MYSIKQKYEYNTRNKGKYSSATETKMVNTQNEKIIQFDVFFFTITQYYFFKSKLFDNIISNFVSDRPVFQIRLMYWLKIYFFYNYSRLSF